MATGNSTTEQTSRQVGAMTLTLPSDREIMLSRTFDAPRRLVWEAFTKPEHLRQWWGPRNMTTEVCEADVRPGGKWRLVHRGPNGEEYAFRGEFREVVPIERIVQTFEWEGLPGHISVETLTLEERDGKTTITGRSLFDSVEDRNGMLQSGMEHGAAESYDRLAELLATLK